MEAIEELSQLSESIMQAAALLADEDVDENSSSSSRRNSTFLNVVALGNVVSDLIYLYLQNGFEIFLSEEKELLFLFSFRFFLISDYKEGRVMYLFFR